MSVSSSRRESGMGPACSPGGRTSSSWVESPTRRRAPSWVIQPKPAAARGSRVPLMSIEETEMSTVELDVEALRQGLRGELLLPDDAGFEDATLIWNARVDRTPALVVRPAGTADVVAA